MSRQQTSGERYRCDNAHTTYEYCRIVSGNMEQHRRQGLARQPGSRQSKRDALGDQPQPEEEKLPTNLSGPRS